jgi:opacity protein-like surface antigen
MRTHRIVSFAVAAYFGQSPLVALANPSPLPPEIGYSRGEMESPRSTAMGGALRALGNSLDGLYLNPANMATSRVYHLGAVAQIWTQAQRQSYGGAAVDSILNPERIAGGIAVTTTDQDPDGMARNSLDMRFALAFPFSDKVFFGATVKYLTLGQDGHPSGALTPTLATGGLRKESIFREISVDAGLTVKPIPELSIAAVGVNLTNPDSALMPLLLGGGIGFGTADFSIEADVGADFTTYEKTSLTFSGGAEYLIAGMVPLRAGYLYDQAFERQAVSFGAGFLSPEFAVDAAMRISVEGPIATAIILGVKYHLDGAGIVTAPQ